MIDTDARSSVKRRLDIDDSDTTFDTAIDDFVLSGVKRLYPIAARELVAESIAVSVDNYGEAIVDLSALTDAPLSARKVEVSSGYGWSPAQHNYHHGTNLYIRELDTGVTTAKVYGLTRFALSTVPEELEQAVLWYAMSEFYDYLSGNKRKYNIYMQSGARSVDNMRDESEYYEQKANVYLNDRTTLYGAS